MARFDVYHLADGGIGIDCQNDMLDDIGTRFVVPLAPRGEGPPPNSRLNPVFDINGEPMIMVTQFATAIRTNELRGRIMSLAEHDYRITGAIDVLIGAG